MNIDLHGKTRSKVEIGRAVHGDSNRYPLSHLYICAADAFGRNETELAVGGRQNLFHVSPKVQVGVSIDGDVNRIAHRNFAQVFFFNIGGHMQGAGIE